MQPQAPIASFDYDEPRKINWTMSYCKSAFEPARHTHIDRLLRRADVLIQIHGLTRMQFAGGDDFRNRLHISRLHYSQQLCQEFGAIIQVEGYRGFEEKLCFGILLYQSGTNQRPRRKLIVVLPVSPLPNIPVSMECVTRSPPALNTRSSAREVTDSLLSKRTSLDLVASGSIAPGSIAPKPPTTSDTLPTPQWSSHLTTNEPTLTEILQTTMQPQTPIASFDYTQKPVLQKWTEKFCKSAFEPARYEHLDRLFLRATVLVREHELADNRLRSIDRSLKLLQARSRYAQQLCQEFGAIIQIKGHSGFESRLCLGIITNKGGNDKALRRRRKKRESEQADAGTILLPATQIEMEGVTNLALAFNTRSSTHAITKSPSRNSTVADLVASGSISPYLTTTSDALPTPQWSNPLTTNEPTPIVRPNTYPTPPPPFSAPLLSRNQVSMKQPRSYITPSPRAPYFLEPRNVIPIDRPGSYTILPLDPNLFASSDLSPMELPDSYTTPPPPSPSLVASRDLTPMGLPDSYTTPSPPAPNLLESRDVTPMELPDSYTTPPPPSPTLLASRDLTPMELPDSCTTSPSPSPNFLQSRDVTPSERPESYITPPPPSPSVLTSRYQTPMEWQESDTIAPAPSPSPRILSGPIPANQPDSQPLPTLLFSDFQPPTNLIPDEDERPNDEPINFTIVCEPRLAHRSHNYLIPVKRIWRGVGNPTIHQLEYNMLWDRIKARFDLEDDGEGYQLTYRMLDEGKVVAVLDDEDLQDAVEHFMNDGRVSMMMKLAKPGLIVTLRYRRSERK
ncbi:MAG: hypothetical protein Q9170_005843 [Blastenia crenularia]